MANYLSMLRSAATGLEVLQDSALASQNNVSNASTPGYAKQSATVIALPFDPDQGLVGGVRSGPRMSSRDQYAEQSVRQTQSSLSASQVTANQMSALEANFDLNDVTGIPARLNSLFTAFSSWSVAPLSASEKQNVISAAQNVATSFNQAATALQQTAQNSADQINTTLTSIDDIAERIRQHNYDIRNGDANNAGSDAKLHSDLEELSGYINFQALWQSDGTVTVLIGNQTALVTGDQKFGFTVTADPTVPPPALAGATPKLQIHDQSGFDVTSTMTGGQLGALLNVRNTVIPSFTGSVTDAGDLNRLAQGFADRVNQILTAGDPNPATSVPLFTYSNLGSAAHSLAVSADMNSSVLSAADLTTTPSNVNGRALQLSALAHPGSATDEIDGLSFTSYFGRISSSVGRLSSEATQAVDSKQQVHAQAVAVRDKISGVSLDEEAVNLTSIQRAYQASSRVVAAVDEMIQLAVNLGKD